MNGLYIISIDIQNDFLGAPTKEKLFFYYGDKWKSDKDRVVIVIYALYGTKSRAMQFRNHIA